MARVKVTTPVPGYSGSVGGVHFANGEAVADTEAQAAEVAYFHTRGYGVEDVDEPGDDGPEPRPAKNASTETWRAWAVEHGGLSQQDAAELTRDQLVELLAASEDNA